MLSRLLPVSIFVVSVIVARLLVLWAGSAAAVLKFVPLRCPLNFFFGVHCPTCGLGRSLMAAWTGRWNESWSFHPAGLVMLGLAVVLSLGWVISPRRVRAIASTMSSYARGRPVTVAVLVVMYAVWGFLRPHLE